MELSVILLLVGITGSCYGAHFRGGTFNWRPVDEHTAEVTYAMSFNGFREPNAQITGGHEVCSEEAKQQGYYLDTPGYLECASCVYGTPESLYPDMEWQCTDFDINGGWDLGKKTFQVTVPDDTKNLLLYYNHCCWVGPIQNVHPYNSLGWRMFTEIDLNVRPDTGLPNSSPITSPIPVQLFHRNCVYWLEIPVTDPDNDPYRCRYTDLWEDECYDPGRRNDRFTMCGELAAVQVFPNCTLRFDTSGPEGYYAVRVAIEDLDERGEPRSRISLSFLLKVSPDASTCDAPVIVSPERSCKILPVGEEHVITVVAEATSENLPIVRIESKKPSGMTTDPEGIQDVYGSSTQKSLDLIWTPGPEHIGLNSLGFNAVDQGGFSSGWTFMNLLVVSGTEALQPVPSQSHPTSGEVVDYTNGWTIHFNRPVRRPYKPAYITLIDRDGQVASRVDASDPQQVRRPSKPAYITLIDRDGQVASRVDASDPQQVDFRDRIIEFNVYFDTNFQGLQFFRLKVDDGVGLGEQQGDCLLSSQPAMWHLLFQGHKPANPTTTPQPPTTTAAPIPPLIVPPLIECKPNQIDIPSPDGAEEGEECFIRPLQTSFSVTSRNTVDIPYEICCPSSCRKFMPTTGPTTGPTSGPTSGSTSGPTQESAVETILKTPC